MKGEAWTTCCWRSWTSTGYWPLEGTRFYKQQGRTKDLNQISLVASSDWVWKWRLTRQLVPTDHSRDTALRVGRNTWPGPSVNWARWIKSDHQQRTHKARETFVVSACSRQNHCPSPPKDGHILIPGTGDMSLYTAKGIYWCDERLGHGIIQVGSI